MRTQEELLKRSWYLLDCLLSGLESLFKTTKTALSCGLPLTSFDHGFLKPELILRWFEAVPGGPGESQDKGKEAQEGLRRARGYPVWVCNQPRRNFSQKPPKNIGKINEKMSNSYCFLRNVFQQNI